MNQDVIKNPESFRLHHFLNQDLSHSLPTKDSSLVDRQVLNFLTDQLAALPNPETIQQFLVHFLTAIALEAHQQPINLLYQLDLSEQGLKIFDPIYGLKNELIAVSQTSINSATNPNQRERYQLELRQLQHLINQLELLFSRICSPESNCILPAMAVPELLANLDQAANQLTISLLSQFGWVETDQLINPSLAIKYHLPWPTRVIAGPKFFYLMPPSPVHPGQLTMALLAQPFYCPPTNSWHLEQWQLLVKKDFSEITELLNGLSPIQLPQPWPITNSELEKAIFDQIITLPANLQKTNGTEILDSLINHFDNHPETAEQTSLAGATFELLAIDNYAQLLAIILSNPNIPENQRLLCWQKIIISGIAHLEPLSKQQLTQIINQITSKKSSTKIATDLTGFAQAIGFASAGLPVDFSAIECLTVGGARGIIDLAAHSQPSFFSVGLNHQHHHSTKISEKNCLTCPECGFQPVYGDRCPRCGFRRGQKKDFKLAAPSSPHQTLTPEPAAKSWKPIPLTEFIATLL